MAIDDLAEFRTRLAALTDAGVEGVVGMGTYDPVRIRQLGRVLTDVLP